MEKLKELNITAGEMDKLTKALKNEEFVRLLGEYANDISDPENIKSIEAELTILEQERGNKVDFYHPEPFRALKTSVNGKNKCYINISTNEKVGKPESTWKEVGDGCTRPCWSLPHVIHPGGRDLDTKGMKIYDVMFHPDILDLANKGEAFMAMVDSAAIDAIQRVFKVTVDKNNVRVLKTKYKGTPRPCVIRTPIPGCKPKEPSEEPDPLAVPYLDEKRPPVSPLTKPTKSPAAKDSSDAEPNDFSIQPQGAKGPTEPCYRVKYVYYIDLQDFRCSRDSAQSPRPKEIVVTIDMPLLKAAADANLEVKERQLLLETKTSAYRLELPLAYPVDENKGEAKFNNLRGQLTVTLPVLPSKEALDFAMRPDLTGVRDDDDRQEEEIQEEDGESKKSEDDEQKGVLMQQSNAEEREVGEKDTRRKKRSEKTEEIDEEAKWRMEERKGQEGVQKAKEQENEKEVGCLHIASICAAPAGEDNRLVASPETENWTVKKETSDFREETEQPGGSVHGSEKVDSRTDAAFPHLRPSEESQTPSAANAQSQEKMKGCCIPEESSDMPATHEASTAASDKVAVCSEEDATSSAKQDEDKLPMEQICQDVEHNHQPPPALLREIDADGKVTIISDHSTSAGFVFQNSLMYELD